MTPTPILIRLDQGAGDAVLASGAIRDLRLAYPGRFRVQIDGTYSQLFQFDPLIAQTPPRHRLGAHRLNALWFSDRDRFAPLWHGWLAEELGIEQFPCTVNHGHIVLSEEELMTPPPISGRYVVLNGGTRTGGAFEVKGSDPEDLAAAVKAFPEIKFVQVGAGHHPCERIPGARDLVGLTGGLRSLVRLVYHSWAVISPVSFLMHLAAALPAKGDVRRHIITVAGGSESPWFYHYGPELNHYIIHTVGELDCCQAMGCWLRRATECKRPHALITLAGEPSRFVPQCMSMAGGRLIKTIRDCLDGVPPKQILPPAGGEPYRRCSDGRPFVPIGRA